MALTMGQMLARAAKDASGMRPGLDNSRAGCCKEFTIITADG